MNHPNLGSWTDSSSPTRSFDTVTPFEVAELDFKFIAVHEVAHALLAAYRSPRLAIWRNPSRRTIDETTFHGRVAFWGRATPQIAIAGELACYFYCQFLSENEDGEWSEDFTFWSEEFIDTFECEVAEGTVSDSDFQCLRELPFHDLCQVVDEVADELRICWPDLLRIVRLLVEQFEEEPTKEYFGFTDWEMKQLLRPQAAA